MPAVRAIDPRMPTAVRPVRPGDAADQDRFLDFALSRHAADPAFVPPLREWQRRQLSPDNRFFQKAELRLFLAERDGAVVGTISALRDRQHEELKKEKIAFFGFFECEADPAHAPETARLLLSAADACARAWGASALRGPRNLSRVEEVGILQEGFDLPPPMLTSHHPPAYAALIEAQGFVEHHDVLAYAIDLYLPDGTERPYPEALSRKAAAADQIPGMTVRPIRWMGLGGDIGRIHQVFVEAFRDVPDNTPMPLAQFSALIRGVLALASREMVQVAMIDGAASGFAACLPELNEAIVAAKGRLFPLGWLRLLRALRSVRTASFKLIGVLPQHRSGGLHARMIVAAIAGVRRAGYRRLEASLIDARNSRMRRVVEEAGMTVYRRWRIYERPVSGG